MLWPSRSTSHERSPPCGRRTSPPRRRRCWTTWRRSANALAAIPRARNRQAADSSRPVLRRSCCIRSGLPHLPWPPDLRPRLAGTLARDGYRIEKIVYQTLPDLKVPAHLYVSERPDATRAGRAVLSRPLVGRQQDAARFPGVLHQHGPAGLRGAELRPVRPGRARRLVARPSPHRGPAGRRLPSRGSPSTRRAVRSNTSSRGRKSTPDGSG